MNPKYLIPVIALGLPLLAAARPVKPGTLTVTNPDGTKTEIRHHGDEHFSYTTDAKGDYILSYSGAKGWQKAVRNGMVLKADAANIEMLRAENEAMNPESVLPTRAGGPARMAALTDEGRSKFPCNQKVRSLVVLVEYSDKPFSIPNAHEAFNKLCNEEGYSDYNARGSARDYYHASSDGQFDVDFDVYGPVKIPYTSAYISGEEQNPGTGKYANFSLLIKSALEQLDGQIDFSKYDYDEDGTVDNIYFFYSGYGQADHFGPGGTFLHDLVWPHQSTYRGTLVLDGKRIGPYACSNEINGNAPESNPYPDGIGAFCHEFGHVLGLPDLYDTAGGTTEVPEEWTVMCSGSYNMNSTCPPLFSAYERWVCGWIEYNDMIEGNHYTLQPNAIRATNDQFGKPDFRSARMRIPFPSYGTDNWNNEYFPDEYFIVENRTKEGFDYSLPTEGALIWYIRFNATQWRMNRVNYNGIARVRVMKVPDGYGQATWPGTNRNYFTSEDFSLFNTSPNFKAFITSISYDPISHLVDFDYNKITDFPDVTTEISTDGRLTESGRNIFLLKWKPVEGATKYLLTVYCMRNGKRSYINGFNETDMGDHTYAIVRNITSSQWSSEVHAYVRVVKDVPSTETSQEITFYPEQLEEGSWAGISDVELDSQITVANGCIYAPEGAQIYNLSGMRVAGEGLAKGIYIVRLAGKSVKVVVR